MNYTHAFIQELKENFLSLHVNGTDFTVELTATEAMQIYEVIEQGTYIILFDMDHQEILFNLTEAQLRAYLPEYESLEEFKDAHILSMPAELL